MVSTSSMIFGGTHGRLWRVLLVPVVLYFGYAREMMPHILQFGCLPHCGLLPQKLVVNLNSDLA